MQLQSVWLVTCLNANLWPKKMGVIGNRLELYILTLSKESRPCALLFFSTKKS